MAGESPHDPPFRADHVGSLLRPPELLKARGDRAAGKISAEELRAIEDQSIREVIAISGRRRTSIDYRWRIPPRDFLFRFLFPGPRRRHRRLRSIVDRRGLFHRSRGP